MATHAQDDDLLESISALRDAAKDAVLEAARSWSADQGRSWRGRLLSSAVNALEGTEDMLALAVERPESVGRRRVTMDGTTSGASLGRGRRSTPVKGNRDDA